MKMSLWKLISSVREPWICCSPNQKTLNKKLIKAAKHGDISEVEKLIEKIADVNVTDKYRNTALHLAAYDGNLKIVEALVSAGAELNTRDVHGMTALDWAIANGHTKIVETLVKEGAELTTTDVHGITALQIAIFEGHYIHVKNAIEEGKKELIAQLGALEHEHVWGEKSMGKLAALCNENSTKNDHIDVLNKPDLQRYIWGFNNKPSLRLKKASQYSAEAATKIQAMARGNLVRKEIKL